MKQILDKHVVCRSIATICLIQGTSWLMLASSTRLYHTVQRFYKPIYYTNLFTETWWAVIFRKTADSSKLYLATGYPLLPTKKKSTRNPQRRCACLLPCGQITNLLSRFTRCFSPDLKISDTVT